MGLDGILTTSNLLYEVYKGSLDCVTYVMWSSPGKARYLSGNYWFSYRSF